MKAAGLPRRSGLGCWGKLMLALGLSGLGLVLGYGLLWGAGAFLIVSDPVKRSDAVVLLSGGGVERAREAAKIYRDGNVGGMFILTETGYRADGERNSHVLYWQVVYAGVPAEYIITTQGRSSSTADEALAVRQTMEKLGLKSCIVVTDPYHTMRTRLIFRQALRGSDIRVRVHPASGHWYRADRWFLSWRGWQTTLLEYAKLAAYLVGVGD
mgnify:FL=1